MKAVIDDKMLRFVEYDSAEIEHLRKQLTWGEGEEKVSLLLSDDKGLYTYSGLTTPLQERLQFPLEICDAPEIVSDLDFTISEDMLNGITLRAHQMSGIFKAIKSRKGLIVVGTGGGKTEMMIATILALLANGKIESALVVTPSVALAEQFYDRAILRGVSDPTISILSSGRKKKTAIIVGVVNSINIVLKDENHELHEYIKGIDALLFDECHHTKADTFTNIILVCNKYKYLLGYSGSPFTDKSIWETAGDALIYGLMGRILLEVPAKYLIEVGLLPQPYIYYAPITNRNKRTAKYFGRYNDIYQKYVIKNNDRNEKIAWFTNNCVALKFPVLILVQRHEHARILMMLFKGQSVVSIFGGGKGLIFGDAGDIEEFGVDYSIFRANFEAGVWDIAIVSLVGDEGMDLPAIGVVLLAGAGKSRIKFAQRVGRGLRNKKIGPNRVYLVDFWDETHVFLLSQAKKRSIIAKEIGSEFVNGEEEFFDLLVEHSKAIENEITTKS